VFCFLDNRPTWAQRPSLELLETKSLIDFRSPFFIPNKQNKSAYEEMDAWMDGWMDGGWTRNPFFSIGF